jgi:hypothetical protein
MRADSATGLLSRAAGCGNFFQLTDRAAEVGEALMLASLLPVLAVVTPPAGVIALVVRRLSRG